MVTLGLSGRTASASSALELVRQAHAREATNNADVALRLYTDALALDPTCGPAYLGLGELRTRHGDLREAERVYSVALEHIPDLQSARLARAYVRRALGTRTEAIEDLLALASLAPDPAPLRILARWYAEESQTPMQLAVWRRIHVLAETVGDRPLLREARATIRALLLLVGDADPVAAPTPPFNAVRKALKIRTFDPRP